MDAISGLTGLFGGVTLGALVMGALCAGKVSGVEEEATRASQRVLDTARGVQQHLHDELTELGDDYAGVLKEAAKHRSLHDEMRTERDTLFYELKGQREAAAMAEQRAATAEGSLRQLEQIYQDQKLRLAWLEGQFGLLTRAIGAGGMDLMQLWASWRLRKVPGRRVVGVVQDGGTDYVVLDADPDSGALYHVVPAAQLDEPEAPAPKRRARKKTGGEIDGGGA